MQDSLVGFTAQLTSLASKARFSNVERKFPNVEHLSYRVWNEKFPNVEHLSSRLCNISVYTNTYDYRYHPEAGGCISTSGISTLPLWTYVCMTCSYNRGRGPTTDLAITEGIRPPNLPNLLVLDEAESLLPTWRLTSKICISTSGISALPRLPILCLGARLSLM